MTTTTTPEYLAAGSPEPVALMAAYVAAVQNDTPECQYCHWRLRMPYRGCRTCGTIGCVSRMRAEEEGR